MRKLERLRKGEAPTLLHTEKGNELIDALNAIIGGEFSPTGIGKFLWSNGKLTLQINAGSFLKPTPFTLSQAGEGKIRVRAGTVNGQLPDGFNLGDSPPFILKEVGEEGHVYIKLVWDLEESEVSTREVHFGETVPEDTSDTFYNEIGTYSTDDDDVLHVSTTIGGSQWFELCADVEPLWGLD